MFSFAVYITSSICYAGENVKTDKQHLYYQIYASGFKALDADLIIQEKNNYEYKISLSAKTYGFLGKLAPWSGDYKTSGTINDNNILLPEKHISSSFWKKSENKKEFSYNSEGNFSKLYIEEKGRDYTPEDFDKDIAKDTIDLLSAIFSMMRKIPEQSSCNYEGLVFDGKRSFILKFQDIEKVILKQSKYNIYSGESYKCQVEVKPEKGKWREKPRGWMSIQEQGRKKGSLPTIWMGKIDGYDYFVPVKIMVKTSYGTMLMHLKKIK